MYLSLIKRWRKTESVQLISLYVASGSQRVAYAPKVGNILGGNLICIYIIKI